MTGYVIFIKLQEIIICLVTVFRYRKNKLTRPREPNSIIDFQKTAAFQTHSLEIAHHHCVTIVSK